ncbi:MAG TPA: HD domain-containing protein [Petrotogaceae bacterium]|jgi:putative nucleotidyltransferase with HDIG domain|nr:HD domain-containing protein [Petrotogaceae bacterium]HNV06642.1 HD domain-containing protein [Petrotogaceae bacterium]HNY37221.1 HD domain-containing protein [Petrotogaceae bacterium]HOG34139.1 HD domain-containing protein [Petrotogaceae bacterium]HPX15224.1 HD domain-containing protein [Petrotogaceae bacterium]
MLNKEEATELLYQNISTETLIKHSRAVGAIMKHLAVFLGFDPVKWEVTGLIHDLDYELTKHNVDQHALKTVEMLKGAIDEEMENAVLAHNDKKVLNAPIEIALYAADPLSGFITAAVLVIPSQDIRDLKVSSLKKKFKDKSFAKGASRENILKIEQLGITLESFFEIALKAFKEESL